MGRHSLAGRGARAFRRCAGDAGAQAAHRPQVEDVKRERRFVKACALATHLQPAFGQARAGGISTRAGVKGVLTLLVLPLQGTCPCSLIPLFASLDFLIDRKFVNDNNFMLRAAYDWIESVRQKPNYRNTMSTPLVTDLQVIPVAGRDSMLLNLSGAHGPFFTRNIVDPDRQLGPYRRRRSARRREDPPDPGGCARAW